MTEPREHPDQLEMKSTPQPRLVTGELAAIEHALAAEVRAHRAEDPLAPLVVLIGGTLLRPYLQRRIARATGGHLNLTMLTPAELALRLGEPAMVAAGRSPLPALATRVLAGEIARGARGYFKPVAHTPGFANALHRLFRELAQAGVEPEALRAAAEAEVAGVQDRYRAGEHDKQSELATLHGRYVERRAAHYGPDECLASADPARLGAERLLVYGLWDPPAALQALLARLAQSVALTAFLPLVGSELADSAHAEMRAWLAEDLGAEHVEAPPHMSRPAAPGVAPSAVSAQPTAALAHLQRSLFQPSPGHAPDDGSGSVHLLSSPDPAREVRAAARACLRWAEAGMPFHEMAIAYRNEDPYRALIESVFREAGIPVYLHAGTPLSERPLGRRASALVRLAGSDLERRAVMELLTDSDLPDELVGRHGGRIPAARWDALSRKAGIVAGIEQWSERLRLLRERDAELGAKAERRGEETPPWLAGRLESIDRLGAFVRELDELLQRRPRKAPFAEHLAYVRELLTTYIREPKPILEALEPLARLDALARPIPFERFREIVLDTIESVRSERALDAYTGAFGRRGVNALDINSLRHLRFAGVIVLGLAERSFPPPPRQDALLLDEERSRLSAEQGWRLPLRALGADVEPLGFALAVQAAEERVQLSYARTQAGEGRAQLPSSLFRAAAEALTGQAVRADALDRADGLPESVFTRELAGRVGPALAEDALTAGEYDRALLENNRPLGAMMLARRPEHERGVRAWRQRWHETALTPFDGVLGPAAETALAAHRKLSGPLSPTALETYATCPMRFFLERVLGLERVEEPEELTTIDPRTRGSLVHRILERFLSELGDDDQPRPERRITHLAHLDRIAREECDSVEAQGLTGFPLVWRYERQAILEDLRTWYEHELKAPERFPRSAHELGFGFGGETGGGAELAIADPLRVPVGEAELRVRGFIDRLDWDPASKHFRVTDYKAGKRTKGRNGNPLKDGELNGGRALQLPLYLLAGARALGLDPERGEARYSFVSRSGGFADVCFEGAAYGERRVELEQVLEVLASEMRAGNFHARPGKNSSNCSYCDFDSLCDARRETLLTRKQDDPQAQALAALEEIE